MSDETPSPEFYAHKYAGRLVALTDLHAKRSREYGIADWQPYVVQWCRECQQTWPCPTYRLAFGESDEELSKENA